MKTAFRPGFFLAATLLCRAISPAAAGWAAGEAPFSARLENGLEILVDTFAGTGVVTVSLWVAAGSAAEERGQEGIAHLAEHMAFKGTLNRAPGVAERELEEIGGRVNAFTSFDYTCYHATVPAEHFRKALEIIADMVLNPVYDQEELAAEREVVLSEIAQLEDNPGRRATLMLYRALFPGRAYGRPVIGFRETAGAVERKELLVFHEKHYRAGNMLLSAAGEIDPQEVTGAAALFLGRARPGKTPRAAGEPAGNWLHAPGRAARPSRVEETAETANSYLRMGWAAPGTDRPAELAALSLGMSILGRGRASRLALSLRDERKLASEVGAGVAALAGGGPAIVSAVVEPGREKETEEAVRDEIRRLLGPGGPTAEELERARAMALADFVFARETSRDRALLAGRHAISGRPCFPVRFRDALEKTGLRQVRAALGRHLDPDHYALALLAPAEASRESPRRPETGARAETGLKTLKNGLAVIMEEDRSAETVSLRLLIDGGRREEEPSKAGISLLAARLAERGAGGLEGKLIAAGFEALGARYRAAVAPDYTVLSLDAPATTFDEALELFAKIVTGPDFPEPETEREKVILAREAARSGDDLFRHAYDLWLANFYPGQGYGLPSSGCPEAINSLSRGQVADFHRRAWRPARSTMALAGNFEPGPLGKRVAELFGPSAWPPAREDPPEEALAIRAAPRAGKTTSPVRSARTWLIAGYPGPPAGHPDYPAVKILNAILGEGMSSRLFRAVREERSLAYSVGSFFPTRAGQGHLVAYAVTDPARVAETLEAISREAGRLKLEEPSEQEMLRARRYLAGGHRLAMETRGGRALYLAWFELLGAGAGFADRYPALLEGVTPAEVRAAARKYLGEPTVSLVGPD